MVEQAGGARSHIHLRFALRDAAYHPVSSLWRNVNIFVENQIEIIISLESLLIAKWLKSINNAHWQVPFKLRSTVLHYTKQLWIIGALMMYTQKYAIKHTAIIDAERMGHNGG